MRKGLVFLYVVLLILGFVGMSNASLVPVGGGDYVYDTEAKIWWWADLRTFTPEGAMVDIGLINTYDNQISYINDELGDDWHMATGYEIQLLAANSGQNIVDSFVPSSSSTGGSDWYYGRYNEVYNPDKHWCASIFAFSDEIVSTFMTDWREKDDRGVPKLGAWVCTYTNPVPIPSAAWLLGSGLIGIVGIRRKLKK